MQAATIGQVELEITIHAELKHVWKALIEETTFWWPKDFYTGTKAKGLYIEPKLGGKMYEDWGDESGVVWYEIFAFDPPHSLDLRGCLAVPYGPALSLLQIKLIAVAEETRLTLSDTIFGVSSDGQEGKRDGWKQIFENGLKNYVETRQ